MKKVPELLEVCIFFVLSGVLLLLFLVNLPLFQEPHGLLVMNELSDFSDNQLVVAILFGSVVVCLGLAVLLLKWIPSFTAGMASNLWATIYFLIWVDSIFCLSIQTQSFRFLALLALGLIFFYLFFFTLHYLGFPEADGSNGVKNSIKLKLMNYWLSGWMGFYFLVSMRLLFNSFGYPEFQWPLAMGFCVLCFLNYLLFLFLLKSEGRKIHSFSRAGRIIFASWFMGIVVVGLVQKWFH